MESFTMTRSDMAHLLLALDNCQSMQPLAVLQEAWRKNHQDRLRAGSTLPAFLSTEVTPVLEKIIKGRQIAAFSLQEIASLGQLIEYSHVSLTSMQNWVKRDFKEFLGSPQVGKKYSINQAAVLLIIEDLKSSLDFESIRKLFHILFGQPGDDSDDLMQPMHLYAAYSSLFEELDANGDGMFDITGTGPASTLKDGLTEDMLLRAAGRYTDDLVHLSPNQREALRNALLVAAVSIQNSYFLSMARRYVNATLFLDF
ncbi:DUF1836 domain-containing protein [Paenibacillus enshidis]|uniref:DUF1836 domain-containing protein n=2 Tax=Paenibacillus TaxID=44249 RepID=A0ABV5AX88_9BACL